MKGQSAKRVVGRAAPAFLADSVGAEADARLASGPGVVHSAFDEALNLLFPGGIVSVVGRSKGMGPLNVTLPGHAGMEFLRLEKPGNRVSVERGLIALGDFRIGLDQAARYRTPVLFSRRPLSRGRILGNVHDAQNMIIETGRLEGLGTLLYPLRGEVAPLLSASPFVHTALMGIVSLSRHFSMGDERGAVAAARGLIGLGVGLTPSGDDLLSGALAALNLGASNGFLLRSNLRKVARGVTSAAGNRTTIFSLNHLQQASVGSVNEFVYGFVEDLYTGSETDMKESLASLVHFGATSGTDTALGATLGVKIALGSEVMGN